VYGSANADGPSFRPVFEIGYIYLLAINSPKRDQPGCPEPREEICQSQKEKERSLPKTYLLMELKNPKNGHD